MITVERIQRQRVTRYQQTQGHAGESQRHRHQDQQRLKVAAKLRRQNQIDQPHAEQKQRPHRLQRFVDVVQFAGKIEIGGGITRSNLFPLRT
jgi:hypothetical protein